MNARLLLSIPLFVGLTTFAGAFNPAPIYKEPPKSAVSSIAEQMQGTWSYAPNTKTKTKRETRVRIHKNTWTNSAVAKGPGRANIAYEMLLDTSRLPVALDLKRNTTSRIMMRGIIKAEANRLIFCYVNSTTEEDRPKNFEDTQTRTGLFVRTMTLTRIEE